MSFISRNKDGRNLIYVIENARGNQEWTIHRNMQHWTEDTQNEDKK